MNTLSIKTDAEASVQQLHVRTIRETPENWQIYRKTSLDDPTFQDLVASIAEVGIKSPLEISADGYIISGHRRYRKADIEGWLDRHRVQIRAS